MTFLLLSATFSFTLLIACVLAFVVLQLILKPLETRASLAPREFGAVAIRSFLEAGGS
jgi:hypothetical protein